MTDRPTVTTIGDGVARVTWPTSLTEGGFSEAVTEVGARVEEALDAHGRVEAWVDPEDTVGQRVATWSGLRREGVMRGGHVAGGVHADKIVYARVSDDPPVADPEGFRGLLNSFLPRKRAISQMLVRDGDDRVLMCQLTYKRDWDLPGGVVEVGESPRAAASREVAEELSLEITAGDLLLTDWLPAWSGWDDAVCLVFDGGAHDAHLTQRIRREEREIVAADFCTPAQVRERAAAFTARRVEAALAARGGEGAAYAESGHLV